MRDPTGKARRALAGAVALAGVLIAGGPAPAQDARPSVVETRPPLPITDFQLTSHAGRPFRLSTLRGSPVLVFFGFTHCPEACPVALGKLAALSRSEDPAVRQARVVMISTDGARDTPAVLRDYLTRLSPDFIGLTGDLQSVGRIAAQFSAVFFRGRAADSSGNYLVDHTTQIYLLDRTGRLRVTFFDPSIDTLARVTGTVARESPASHNPE